MEQVSKQNTPDKDGPENGRVGKVFFCFEMIEQMNNKIDYLQIDLMS